MPVFYGTWIAHHEVVAVHSVRATIMHAMQSCWNCLTKMISFAAEDETSSGRVIPDVELELPIKQEIRRARTLLRRVESTGVRFPSQIHDALERARVAHEQNCWTLQIERGFYSALGLLESIVRPQSDSTMKSSGFSGSVVHENDGNGWTVIISNRRKVLDGSW
jgi:hypothetical protein